VALALFGESVAHRVELANLELKEAREHVIVSVTIAGAAGALSLLTGFACTLTIASVVWDQPHREWWLTGLATVYLIAALAAAHWLSRRLRTWQPFEDTQRQLHQDHQCLRDLIKTATR
jgi:uncharacterized membrane protein YqjE